MSPTPWTTSGLHRLRPRGFFRRYSVLQVWETRRVFRPIYEGHTPQNWKMQSRWRDATFAEAMAVEATLDAALLARTESAA